MNKLILVSALSLIVVACGDEASTVSKDTAKTASTAAPTEQATNTALFDKKTAVIEAKMITKAFGGALKTKLKAAMTEGGPVNALEVCNKEAIAITEKVAQEQGASISRVSLKNRNPTNVPNDWQKAVLEDFDARAAKGEDIKTMGFAEVVENDGKKQLRFMKALPTGDLCLSCHGDNINPALQAKITELYPEDKAIGYKKGQVRGAIIVIKDAK
ncbi:MAG: DUF3365 domain-containing protein [Thiotrichaceae bacterium]|nr:DUF3365 domain-containing protein [Thiotrichaceae bacterium]